MTITQQLTGIQEAIDAWNATPEQVGRALKRAGKISSAAGYREGLKTLDAAGLSREVIRGRRRWFVGYHVDDDGVEIDLWLGRNPLTGERRRGQKREPDNTITFPENIDAMLDKVVVPVVISVFEREVEKSIRGQVIRG